MTSCEVVLAYSHLANDKSKRKHTHLNNTQTFTLNYKCLTCYHIQFYRANSTIRKNPLKSRLALDELLPSARTLVS